MHTGVVIMQVLFRQPYCQEVSFCRGQWLRHTTGQYKTSEKRRVLSCRCFVSTHHSPWRLGEHHGKEERMQEPMNREKSYEIYISGHCMIFAKQLEFHAQDLYKIKPIQIPAWRPHHCYQRSYWHLITSEGERVTLLWEHGCWLFAHVSVANDTHVYVGSVRPWVINKYKEISWQGDGVGRVGERYW